MRPEQVIDEKLNLLLMHESKPYHDQLNRMLSDWLTRQDGRVEVDGDWATGNTARLWFCEAYFVTEQMGALIDWAARGLDNTDTWSADLFPTQHGFLWLEEPILQGDLWGKTTAIRALQWNKTHLDQNSMSLVSWADASHPQDSLYPVYTARRQEPNWLAQVGRLQPFHWDVLHFGKPVGPMLVHADSPEAMDEYRAKYYPAMDVDPANFTNEVPNIDRRLLALFMLMSQRVTRVSQPTVPRMVQKRADRKGGMSSHVSVIDLRHHSNSADRQEGESVREWTMRWVVRGHWRRLRDEHGAYTRKVWIAPYVKGPDDKPLVTKDKVFKVSP